MRGSAESLAEPPGKGGALILIPAVLALAVSASTLPGDFVFDDAVLVHGDPRIRSFDLRRIFLENYWGEHRRSPNWRPLTVLTYALNHRISSQPWAFHAANALLHAAAAGMFFLVARRILPAPWAAAGAACLFAVLPIHTEAVANIVGRAEILAALAVFGAWWIALRAEGRGGPGSFAGIATATFLGMLCKENAAVAAGLIPLSIILLRRKVPWEATAAALCGVAVYMVLWKLVLGGGIPAQGSTTIIDNPLSRTDALTRAVNAAGLLGLYAFRTVLPIRLAGDHSYDQIPVLPLSGARPWLEAAVVVAAFAVPVALLWRRQPALAIGFAAFPVAFAASANVLFPIGTIFAERLAYLPSAGYCLALAGALAWFAGTNDARRKAAIIFLVFLTAAYGARSFARNFAWADAALFNLRLAQESPRSTRAHLKASEGHVLLARRAKSARERAEHLALAQKEVEESLRIYPGNPGAQTFQALIHLENQRFQEALRTIAEAEAAFDKEGVPRNPELEAIRGEVLFNLGRLGEALRALDANISRLGPSAKALNLRGAIRLRLNDLEGARKDLEAAIAQEPEVATGRMNRGILNAQAGRLEEARQDFEDAVRLAPEDPQVYANRGYFRYIQGQVQGALEDYRAGLKVCEERGTLAAAAGESVLSFRKRIFDVLLHAGDAEGARRELEAIRAIPSPLAPAAVKELEAMLPR